MFPLCGHNIKISQFIIKITAVIVDQLTMFIFSSSPNCPLIQSIYQSPSDAIQHSLSRLFSNKQKPLGMTKFFQLSDNFLNNIEFYDNNINMVISSKFLIVYLYLLQTVYKVCFPSTSVLLGQQFHFCPSAILCYCYLNYVAINVVA